jgi:peptidoglycan/xylan/chitin deacetylase (PgdA/CDA1 family)
VIRRASLVSAAVVGAHLLPAAAQPLSALRAPLGIESETADRAGVALTFDDGPHPQGTPAILDALARCDARATFFLVGEQVVRWPQLVGEIAAAGHTVALHGDRHRNLLRLAPAQTADDLERGWERVAAAAGAPPLLYRPPYGVFSAAALAVARRRGWRTMLWTGWGRDWERRASAASIAMSLAAGLRPGAVLLLHDADHYSAPDSWRRTAAALPRLLDIIGERRLAVVGL